MAIKICRLKISVIKEYDVEIQVGREDEKDAEDVAIETASALIANGYGAAKKTRACIETEGFAEKEAAPWMCESRYLNGDRYVFHTENKQ